MNTEDTRALMERFIAARVVNDAAALETLFTDDVEWHLPVSAGAGPFVGKDVVIAALTGGVSGKILDVSTMKRDAWKVIVDGDTAAVQQRVSARTLQDTDYVNEYCWVYTCRDGKVAHMMEYADTLNAARIFGFVKS